MNNYVELEVKILNINTVEIIKKLNKLKAKKIGTNIQKIYTYDCYSPILMFELAISDYKLTNSINSKEKLINIYKQLEPVISEEEKNEIYQLYGKDLIGHINSKDFNINTLENKKLLKIIEVTKERFFKWIRLRETGDKVELTIKYIYNTASEYDMEEVKEIEIKVDNFDTANELIEEMGYYKKKLIEKKRTSYKLKDSNIEIDEWPLINPYIEIEAKSKKEIYNIVNLLGYSEKDAKVMNTDDVYLLQGIHLSDYKILTFKEKVLISEI